MVKYMTKLVLHPQLKVVGVCLDVCVRSFSYMV